MSSIQIRNSLLLLLTATIWGIAFVAQSVGLDYVDPFTFNAVRCTLGGLVLIPFILFQGRKKSSKSNDANRSTDLTNSNNITSSNNFTSFLKKNQKLIIGGLLCGLFLFVASNLQQFGIKTTTAGKAGFITSCYIIIVPILGLALKKKTGPFIWIGVVTALVGMYLLCMTEGFTLQFGDFLIFLCAIIFSFHILTIDYFSPLVDGVKMSCIQFFVCGFLSAIGMFIFETPKISNILMAASPILYSGILSCGVAYTLQIIGQKNLNPTVASLIMSLESVVSVIAGWILLHEILSNKEIIGCIFMFCAIILAQIPQKEKSDSSSTSTSFDALTLEPGKE